MDNKKSSLGSQKFKCVYRARIISLFDEIRRIENDLDVSSYRVNIQTPKKQNT